MPSHYARQGGNVVTGNIQDKEFQILGSNISVGGNFSLHAGQRDTKANDCFAALFSTNPVDDRSKLVSYKGQVADGTCDWILGHPRYKHWKNVRTQSQLLLITGRAGMGKTMLSIFLTRELEKEEDLEHAVLLYYFCDSRDDKRNTAVYVLRGLIFLLLKERPGLMKLILPDFEFQNEKLFSQTSLEALWRIFESMIRDPSTGQVYCIIDGLDECKEDSLWHLLRKIKFSFPDQPQMVVNEDGSGQIPKSTGQTLSNRLKLIIVSRTEPGFIAEEMSGFPQLQLGDAHIKANGGTNARPRKGAKLADLAAAVMRKHSLGEAATEPSQQVQFTPEQAKSHANQTDIAEPTPIQHDHYPALAPATESEHTTKQEKFELAELPKDRVLAEVSRDDACGEVDEGESDEADEVDEAEHVVEPLQLYIEAKVEEISAELDYSQSLRTSVGRAFQDRGDGTLLWVDLAIEELRKAKSQQQDLQEVLAHLPTSLDEMHYRTLCQVPPHLVSLVAAILRWVIAARRPLTPSELSIALNLANHSPDPTGLLKQGIDACGHMVAITDDETVNILHNSAKDFLTGKPPQLWTNTGLSQFLVCMEEADREIAHFCLAYLEQGCLKGGSVSHQKKDQYFQRVNQFPFLPYATLYWPEHLRSAAQPFSSLSSSLFFSSKSPTRKTWWHTYWTMTTGKGTILAPRKFTLLHLAAYLDLLPLAKHLLQRGELYSRLDQRDSHSVSALDYTVELGNMSVFLFLLQHGASQECKGTTLLIEACGKGQKEVAEHFLKIGYNVDGVAPPLSVISVIEVAARRLPGVLDQGLNYDTDKMNLLFTRNIGDKLTALHEAAFYGHAAVVEMLLKWKANAQATSTTGWTALHSAAWTGQIKCVPLLLEAGADATAQNDSGWIPLHCAASRGKISVVKHFLEQGVPVDAVTGKQKTALHLSAYEGHASIVSLLINSGSQLEAQSHKGETPLHLATRSEKPEVVELLLTMGADRTAVSNVAQTALEVAREVTPTKGIREVIRILQTFGTEGYQPWKPAPANTFPNGAATSQESSNCELLPTTTTFQANVRIGIRRAPHANPRPRNTARPSRPQPTNGPRRPSTTIIPPLTPSLSAHSQEEEPAELARDAGVKQKR
ncbi:MAG: hypothetical protein M1840_003963 [Geoglossum simile]|nr:MAG: hypothetical protein M1840_003963 [Geoglossum simile]